MKNFLKFILYLLFSIFNPKNRFIILTPNLTILNFNKVFIFDKNEKYFYSYKIRNKYDYSTVLEIYFHQSYDIKTFKFYDENFKKLEKDNLLIVDCGSNIGCSTNFFLKSYKNSKVVSIEPDLENFKMLKENVNERHRVELINSAISNEIFTYKVVADQNDPDDPRGKNLIETKDINSQKSIIINDILIKKNEFNFYPYIIKIDIEGHENKLFESNTEWIDQFKIIIIELHDWMLPGTSNSKNFFKQISSSMQKHKRDMIISGENLISIKY